MKLRVIVILLIGILYYLPIKAQYRQMRDSLLNEYNTQTNDSLKTKTLFFLFNAEIYTNPEKAKEYALEQLVISKKIGYVQSEGLSHYNLGVYYSNQSQLDSAKHYYTNALSSYRKIKDQTNIALAYGALSELESSQGNYNKSLAILDTVMSIYQDRNDFYRMGNTFVQKGAIFYEKGSYKLALEESLRGLSILDTINKPIRQADALSQLGNIEIALNNLDNALNYKQKSLDIYEEYDDKVYQSYALNSISEILILQEQFEQALEKNEKSIELSTALNIVESTASALLIRGKIAHITKDYNKAQNSLKQSYIIFDSINDPIGKTQVLLQLGITNKQKSNYKESIKNLNRAIRIADSFDLKQELSEGYFERSEMYSKLNSYQNSLDDFINHKKVNDSIFNITKSQQIEELRTIYDTEKKEQQLAIQKNEIALLEQKAEIDNLQKTLLGGGLALSVLLFGLGFYGIRQKLKRNKLEKEKLDAELEFKKKELTTHALHLAKKNETLEGLKQQAQELTSTENRHGFKKLIRSIDFDLQDDNNWENFARYFEEVHKDFNGNVKSKYPQVTSNELRLMALLKMNLSSKEIANILNISTEGIKKARYRLRKKLDIKTEESLEALVINL